MTATPRRAHCYLAVLLSLCLSTVVPTVSADSADAAVARITYSRQGFWIDGVSGKPDMNLVAGQRVSTGPGGRALTRMTFADSATAVLVANTEIALSRGQLDLIRGSVSLVAVKDSTVLHTVAASAGAVDLRGASLKIAVADAHTLTVAPSAGVPHVRLPRLHKMANHSVTVAVTGGALECVSTPPLRAVTLRSPTAATTVTLGADCELTLAQGTAIRLTADRKAGVVSVEVAAGALTAAGKTHAAGANAVALSWTPRPWPGAADTAVIAAADTAVIAAAAPPPATLPTAHAWQRSLRDYIAGLAPADVEHGVAEPITEVPPADAEQSYRLWLLARGAQPVIGTKRGQPGVNVPPRLFMLAAIEGDTAIRVPPVWTAPLAWLAGWDNPGNPYHGSAALQRRVLICNAVHMIMLDHQLETAPEKGGNRTDWFAPQLIQFSYGWRQVRAAAPAAVQQAYETGLLKMAERVLDWGIKGEETNLDAFAAIALWYTAEALADPAFTARAKARARTLLADPRFFHPAGYFAERGGPDINFGGMPGFVAVWTALASDWAFAREAVDSWYALRTHLTLPDPDGVLLAPSHFNTRTSAGPPQDQWEWGFRNLGGAMITDAAACLLAPLPDTAALAEGHRALVGQLNFAIKQNPLVRDETGKKRPAHNDELKNRAWRFNMWPSWNYPLTTHPPYDHAPPDAYARRRALQRADSPLLKLPVLRGPFTRQFADAFTVTRTTAHAAILHTGVVAEDELNSGLFHFTGPHGFGGGQLSAFWTPKTGSVILGRRGGMTWDKNFDALESWRLWPIHAVSGSKADNKVFSSARIVRPHLERQGDSQVTASGVMPREMLGQGKVLEGTIRYTRTFTLAADQVTVDTAIESTGQDTLHELIETIPVLLRGGGAQRKVAATAITFRVGDGVFAPATSQWTDNVTAVRLQRFDGTVRISFAVPQRLRLSAKDWQETYVGRTSCRNIHVDLMAGRAPRVLRQAGVTWSIAAE
jgi:hypothetical protein